MDKEKKERRVPYFSTIALVSRYWPNWWVRQDGNVDTGQLNWTIKELAHTAAVCGDVQMTRHPKSDRDMMKTRHNVQCTECFSLSQIPIDTRYWCWGFCGPLQCKQKDRLTVVHFIFYAYTWRHVERPFVYSVNRVLYFSFIFSIFLSLDSFVWLVNGMVITKTASEKETACIG